MAHIYSGSRLYPGLAQEYRLLLLGTYHYASHTALQIQATASGDLLLRAPHNTSEITTIINITLYWFPSVSLTPV